MSFTRSFDRARGCVVIISATDEPQAFCSGFVLRKSEDGVVLVCPSEFIDEGNNRHLKLQVCFCDRKMLAANVLSQHGVFSLLSTAEKHDACVTITWSGKEHLEPKQVFTFVAISPTNNEKRDAYLSVETLKAFSFDAEKEMVKKSDDYFMVLCDDLLAKNAAVVFTSSGALGVIIQKCRDKKEKEGKQERWPGDEMSVVLKASALKRLFHTDQENQPAQGDV